MSLSRHYQAIENAEDARAALMYVFMAAGDSSFTADKRVNECFFTRGRGREMDSEIYSYVQSSEDLGEEDTQVEASVSEERLKILNRYLGDKISAIEDEYESEKRITKNIRGRSLDLKGVYAYILSKIYSPDDLKDFVSPDSSKDLWKDQWDTSHLEFEPLNHYSNKDVISPDKGETKLLKGIKDKISYDRYKILDDLITYFNETDRTDISEYIQVNGFKFINDSSTGIINQHDLSDEDFHVVNGARVTYISRRKIDLNYALELVNLPATTYKKRSSKIKLELVDLGEEFGNGVNNSMKEYLIS